MKEFILESKVVWRKSSQVNIENHLYPSIFKDVSKKEAFLKDNFTFEIVDATMEKMENFFLPLYYEEVASRKDFTLNKEGVLNDIKKKLGERKYKLMLIYFEEKVIFGWFFCLRDNGLFMTYRAFNRNFDKKMSRKSPISYWAEEMLFKYGKEQGVEFFSHGKDTHPYINRSRLGLPLYKIKVGMSPKRADNDPRVEKTVLKESEIIEKKVPLLFFSDADQDGYYQKCYLYYPKGSLDDSYVNEFRKVIEWIGVGFIEKEY